MTVKDFLEYISEHDINYDSELVFGYWDNNGDFEELEIDKDCLLEAEIVYNPDFKEVEVLYVNLKIPKE